MARESYVTSWPIIEGQLQVPASIDQLRGWNDGPVLVKIWRQQALRSSQANRRYWALLTAAAAELGYDDPTELHEGLKLKFLRDADDAWSGLARTRSTTALDTSQFTEYCARVERFFSNDLHLDLTMFWNDHEPAPGAYA